MNARLVGKVALVTGASRGIGFAVARRFAREGAHIIAVARTTGGLEELDDVIKAEGAEGATLVPLDLTDYDKIDQMALALYRRFGRLDILVGNATTLGVLGPLGHLDPKEFKRVMDLNVTANWRLIRAFDPLLRAAPAGRAIFTTCEAGHMPKAYWSAYGVSKAALDMMARTYGAEQGRTRVTVTLIDPGPVATSLRKQAFPGEDPAELTTPDAAAESFVAAAE